MKKTLLTLLAICATTQAFAFPDISKYQHTKRQLDGGEMSYITGYDKPITLNYAKYKDIYLWSGVDPVTGYTIWVTTAEKDIDTKCYVFKGDDFSASFQTELGVGIIYSFDRARVFVYTENGEVTAVLQSL